MEDSGSNESDRQNEELNHDFSDIDEFDENFLDNNRSSIHTS